MRNRSKRRCVPRSGGPLSIWLRYQHGYSNVTKRNLRMQYKGASFWQVLRGMGERPVGGRRRGKRTHASLRNRFPPRTWTAYPGSSSRSTMSREPRPTGTVALLMPPASSSEEYTRFRPNRRRPTVHRAGSDLLTTKFATKPFSARLRPGRNLPRAGERRSPRRSTRTTARRRRRAQLDRMGRKFNDLKASVISAALPQTLALAPR
jgi:hypothetical protein